MFSFVPDIGKWGRLAIIAGFLILAFLPVRISVSGPAEIVAVDPRVVTAPFSGVLEEIRVAPGDTVDKDDIVALMDKISLQSQVENKEKALETARSELSGMRRMALSEDRKSVV